MRILFLTFFLTIYSFLLNAEIVNDVEVNNNKRIIKESIISLGGIKFGNDYEQADLDKVLKSLYETNFFSDIKISIKDNKMIIYVEENKIIQSVKIIGIKSTAIKFKNNIKLFVSSCYLLTFSLIAYLFKESMGFNIFTLFLFMFFLSLIYQLKIFKEDNPNSCLKAFKTNNLSGLLIFLSLFFKS